MITLRPANKRGHANHGWLDSWHTFSFANYYDPKHMGYRSLRVINDDRIAPRMGFGTHPHEDMEIVTWVLSGELEHKDSTGTTATLYPGIVQRMSAGSGIAHSEYNRSDKPLHLLQIWIEPLKTGTPPAYAEKPISKESRSNRLALLVSPDGRDGSLTIGADVTLATALLAPGATVTHALKKGRGAWIQVASGKLTVNGKALETGDGAIVEDEPVITLTASADSEVLLFDLA
jgi:redox-sensitive bicupin YhaK (pirin superfamily)